MKPYIYLFRDLRNGSPVYVGQHNGSNKNYFTGSRILNQHFTLWGEKKFNKRYSKEVIWEKDCTANELDDKEIHFISKHNTLESGYNLTIGGGTTTGLIMDDKAKANMSKASKGKPKSDTHRENIRLGQLGIKCKEETKEKIRKTLTGRKNGKCSKATKEKIRQTKIGKKNPMYGKKMSAEQKKKISDSMKKYKSKG